MSRILEQMCYWVSAFQTRCKPDKYKLIKLASLNHSPNQCDAKVWTSLCTQTDLEISARNIVALAVRFLTDDEAIVNKAATVIASDVCSSKREHIACSERPKSLYHIEITVNHMEQALQFRPVGGDSGSCISQQAAENLLRMMFRFCQINSFLGRRVHWTSQAHHFPSPTRRS